MRSFFLELLTRPGCHLCEEAEPVAQRVARLVGAELRRVDVDSDPELAVDWGLRIPVLRGPSGRVLAEGRLRLSATLAAASMERLRRRP